MDEYTYSLVAQCTSSSVGSSKGLTAGRVRGCERDTTQSLFDDFQQYHSTGPFGSFPEYLLFDTYSEIGHRPTTSSAAACTNSCSGRMESESEIAFGPAPTVGGGRERQGSRPRRRHRNPNADPTRSASLLGHQACLSRTSVFPPQWRNVRGPLWTLWKEQGVSKS
jgi:hypothetical protein